MPYCFGIWAGGAAAAHLIQGRQHKMRCQAFPPGLPAVTLHVTGFGAFGQVRDNPTSAVCRELRAWIKEGHAPQGVPSALLQEFADSEIHVEGMEALEVSAEACCAHLLEVLGERAEKRGGEDPFAIVHLGVSGVAKGFLLECRGANFADFRIPDVKGWQPQGEPIVPAGEDMLYTTLPLPQILGELHDRGVECAISTDAGRYICNYMFYSSLHAAAPSGTPVLFVHVPPFECLDQATQVATILCLFLAIAHNLRGGHGDQHMSRVVPAATSRPLG